MSAASLSGSGHISDNVPEEDGKTGKQRLPPVYEGIEKMNEKAGKKQYLVPYLMSSHLAFPP